MEEDMRAGYDLTKLKGRRNPYAKALKTRSRFHEKMAGILGTGGKVTKALLEERAKDRKREGCR
jgi:hypothetical protein